MATPTSVTDTHTNYNIIYNDNDDNDVVVELIIRDR